jgi:hypothetical protein
MILTEKEKNILFLLVTDRTLDRIPLPLTEKELDELDDLLDKLSEDKPWNT